MGCNAPGGCTRYTRQDAEWSRGARERTREPTGRMAIYLDADLRAYPPAWRVLADGSWQLVRVTEQREPGGAWVPQVRTLCTLRLPPPPEPSPRLVPLRPAESRLPAEAARGSEGAGQV